MKYRNSDYFGFLLIDKPKGATSHDVVAEVRRKIGCKVGHTGTLDPFATGLLIIALGKATRLIDYLQKQDKEYLVTMILGEEKDSYDVTGKTIETSDYSRVTKEKVEEALKPFIGEIMQSPPVFSALKVDGRRAYDLARKGEAVELEKRSVRINSIKIVSMNLPLIELKISCSVGTYIRSLVHDLGLALGTNAYAKELRRTKNSVYDVKDSITIPDFLEMENSEIVEKLISPIEALKLLPTFELSDDQFADIKDGKTIVWGNVVESFADGVVIYKGELTAIVKFLSENGQIHFKPDKVFCN